MSCTDCMSFYRDSTDVVVVVLIYRASSRLLASGRLKLFRY